MSAKHPDESRRPLLAIDVGNSNIVAGVALDGNWIAHWRMQTVRERTSDEYGLLFRQFLADIYNRGAESPAVGLGAIVMASVVPPLTPALITMCREKLGLDPLVVDSHTAAKLPVEYDPPGDVGADRLANAVGALHRYGGPCIVVDVGTATTFDAVSRDGVYLGGAIAPGIGISMEALFHRAARLPRVELRRPERSIGRSTVESLQSGFLYGFAGQVAAIVDRFREELGPDTRVIATGGFAELIAAETAEIDCVDQMLTLDGLRLIWERTAQS